MKKIIIGLLTMLLLAVIYSYFIEEKGGAVTNSNRVEIISNDSNTQQEKIKNKIMNQQSKNDLVKTSNEIAITECKECDNKLETIEMKHGVVSAKDIEIIDDIAEKISIDDQHESIDKSFQNESVNQAWAVGTEDNINNIFLSNENNPVLLENGLEFTGAECRTSICNISFVPTESVEGMDKIKQMLALTSFLDQNQALADAQMYTEYTQDGQFIVKLDFKK